MPKCNTTWYNNNSNVRCCYISALVLSPEERSCYVFSTLNSCCEFLAFYGVITQSVIQSFLKTPVCGASFSQMKYYSVNIYFLHNGKINLWKRKKDSNSLVVNINITNPCKQKDILWKTILYIVFLISINWVCLKFRIYSIARFDWRFKS